MLLSKATELTFADGTDYRSLTAVACDNGNKHDCSREVVTAVGSGGEGGGGGDLFIQRIHTNAASISDTMFVLF